MRLKVEWSDKEKKTTKLLDIIIIVTEFKYIIPIDCRKVIRGQTIIVQIRQLT